MGYPPEFEMMIKEGGTPMKEILNLLKIDSRFSIKAIKEEGENVKVVVVEWRKLIGNCPVCGRKARKVHQVYSKPRRVLHELSGPLVKNFV